MVRMKSQHLGADAKREVCSPLNMQLSTTNAFKLWYQGAWVGTRGPNRVAASHDMGCTLSRVLHLMCTEDCCESDIHPAALPSFGRRKPHMLTAGLQVGCLTMRSGSTANILAECKLQYYRISECA